jgi:hypothetical protein
MFARLLHRGIAPLVATAAILLAPAVSGAQAQPALSDLVVEWARGRYASPLLCEMDGKLVRGVRRVILRPPASSHHRSSLVIQFIDIKADDASRCVTSTGQPMPNLVGQVELRLPGSDHPETARRDFKRAMQREHGFDFDVLNGIVRVQTITSPPAPISKVDYRGGRAALRLALPATDAAREMAEFQSPRKLVLSLQPAAGAPIELPIFQVGSR